MVVEIFLRGVLTGKKSVVRSKRTEETNSFLETRRGEKMKRERSLDSDSLYRISGNKPGEKIMIKRFLSAQEAVYFRHLWRGMGWSVKLRKEAQ